MIFRLSFLLSLLFANSLCAQMKAINFEVETTGGRNINLFQELTTRKIFVLDFFFADCTPCQTLSPQLDQLYRDYGSGMGRVEVLGLSDRDNNQRLKFFDQQYGTTYPSAGTEGGGDVASNLYIGAYPFLGWPTYAVVCPDSSVVRNIGPVMDGLPELRAVIDSCLSLTSTSKEVSAKPSLSYSYIHRTDQLYIKIVDGYPILTAEFDDLNGRLIKTILHADLNSWIAVPEQKGLLILKIQSGDGVAFLPIINY